MTARRSTYAVRGLLAAALVIVAARTGRAVNLVAYQQALHDRFYTGPDRAFIGEGHDWSRPGDWSGVGRFLDPTSFTLPNGTFFEGTFGWSSTMISEHYFLTAFHVHHTPHEDDPENVPPVRFHRDNDPNGEYWEGSQELVPSGNAYPGVRVGSADLWLGRFEDDVTPPDWVRRYPLVKRDRTTNWPTYVNPEIYLHGMGVLPPAGLHDETVYTSVHMGRNEVVDRLTGFTTFDSTVPPGLGADEAAFEDKDSSSPSFAITPAGPALFAINSTSIGGPTMPEFWSAIQALIPPTETLNIVTDLVGDLNADYDVTTADSDILESNFGLTPVPSSAYFRGDLNRDGIVDQADRDVMAVQLGKKLRSPADFDQNHLVNATDFVQIADNWLTTVPASTLGDVSGDSLVNVDDLLAFEVQRTTIFTGPPTLRISGDANFDGAVTTADMALWKTNFDTTGHLAFTNGDVTGDGAVGEDDVHVILANLNTLFADVDGNLRVNVNDAVAVVDVDNWLQTTTGGRTAGDVNLDGVVDEADLAAVGSFLGFSYRPQSLSGFENVLPGDYNGDFAVDGDDLLVWQALLGSTTVLHADGNKNGEVDAADLLVWQEHFDGEPPPEPPFGAVPEPSAGLLVAIALVVARWRRRA